MSNQEQGGAPSPPQPAPGPSGGQPELFETIQRILLTLERDRQRGAWTSYW